MPYAEAMRQTRSRADQEAHAPFYVQYEVIEKTFQSEVHPNASVFADVINREIEKVNSHVVACLGALESAAPTSDSELVRCSADCGSVVTFIHCNRNALRELAKEFEEKMRRMTWEGCTPRQHADDRDRPLLHIAAGAHARCTGEARGVGADAARLRLQPASTTH